MGYKGNTNIAMQLKRYKYKKLSSNVTIGNQNLKKEIQILQITTKCCPPENIPEPECLVSGACNDRFSCK